MKIFYMRIHKVSAKENAILLGMTESVTVITRVTRPNPPIARYRALKRAIGC